MGSEKVVSGFTFPSSRERPTAKEIMMHDADCEFAMVELKLNAGAWMKFGAELQPTYEIVGLASRCGVYIPLTY
jgi:hypothetical protein